MNSAASAQPEKPSEFPRRILIGPGQAAAVLLLLAIPVLALARLLGEGREQREARAGGLVLRIEAPVRARSGSPVTLRIAVEAPAAPAGPRARVEVAAGYLERFSDLRTQPGLGELTEEAAVFQPAGPAAGGRALILIHATPEHPGRARGYVRASLPSGERVEIPLDTLVFP